MNPRFKRAWNIATIDIQVRYMRMVRNWNGGVNVDDSKTRIQTDEGNYQGQPDSETVLDGTEDQPAGETGTGGGGE